MKSTGSASWLATHREASLSTESAHIAVDCGAESSRVMVVQLDRQRRSAVLHPITRFPTRSQQRGEGWFWCWQEHCQAVRAGVEAALQRFPQAQSVAVDTWGVDVVLCNQSYQPLADPRCYRDPRGARGQARLDGLCPRPQRFRQTGCAQLPINTLDQLSALALEEPELLANCAHLVFLPDYLSGMLSGIWGCERSIAATSSCTLPGAEAWHHELLATIGIDSQLFAPISPSGRILGPLLGYPHCQVIAAAGHDTAAAIAALPGPAESTAYLSCGTWSLLGTVIDAPALAPEVAAAGFSNEAHWDGRIRLNRNIMGLWILQQCRQDWLAAGGDGQQLDHAQLDYAQLAQAAAQVADVAPPLDVDDPRFLAPSSAEQRMSDRVSAWYQEQGIAPPTSPAETTRAILAGLAQAYAQALTQLQHLSGRRIECLVLLGGGGRNELLRQLTREACGIRVEIGSSEATALGNALIQSHSLGQASPEDCWAYARKARTSS